MSYYESPDPLTDKAPEHQKTALALHKKSLSDFGKVLISPSSKKFSIIIKNVTSENTAIYSPGYGEKPIEVTSGYKITFTTKDKTLFNIILEDIRKISGRKYNSTDKYWYIPESSKEELEKFMFKYSLDSKLDYPIEPPRPREAYSSDWETTTKSSIPNLVDIKKIKIGDIVIANWVHEGKIYSTEVLVTGLATDESGRLKEINFKNKEKFNLWDDLSYESETRFSFNLFGKDLHFDNERYLTYKTEFSKPWEDKEHILSKIKDTSTDFKVGDIVKANWSIIHIKDSIKEFIPYSSDGVIDKIWGEAPTYEVKLLESKPPDYKEGDLINFTLPFNEKQWLEHKHPIVPVKKTESPQQLLERISKSLLNEVWKPPILSEEEVEEHESKLREAILKKSSKSEIAYEIIESQVETLEKAYIDEAKAAGRKQVENNDVAKLIKEVLKLYYPKTKFSVRTSRYSIDVRWEFGPTQDHVYRLVNKYHDKTFDGMTDSTSYLDTPWNNDSVSVQRNIPPEFWLKTASEIAKYHDREFEPRTYEEANKIFIDSKSLWDIVTEKINNTDY